MKLLETLKGDGDKVDKDGNSALHTGLIPIMGTLRIEIVHMIDFLSSLR